MTEVETLATVCSTYYVHIVKISVIFSAHSYLMDPQHGTRWFFNVFFKFFCVVFWIIKILKVSSFFSNYAHSRLYNAWTPVTFIQILWLFTNFIIFLRWLEVIFSFFTTSYSTTQGLRSLPRRFLTSIKAFRLSCECKAFSGIIKGR